MSFWFFFFKKINFLIIDRHISGSRRRLVDFTNRLFTPTYQCLFCIDFLRVVDVAFCWGVQMILDFFEVLTLIIRVCESIEAYDSSCTHLAFKIALCGLLERTEPFIWHISYFDSFTCIVIFCAWVCGRGAYPFLVF